MKATVPIYIRVPEADAKLLERVARIWGLKLATYVRRAAVSHARCAMGTAETQDSHFIENPRNA